MSRRYAPGMDVFAEIKRKKRFVVPALYRAAWRYEREAWDAEERDGRAAASLTMPSLTQLALDFRFVAPDDILAWNQPDYWKRSNGFVPVGRNAAGDDYVWYPRWKARAGVPICLAAHDDNRCELVAPHLEGLLYAEALHGLAYRGPDDTAARFDVKRRAVPLRMRAAVAALRPFLRRRWHADLASLIERRPVRWTQLGATVRTWLTEDELNERIARVSPLVGRHFEHMRPL